MTVVVPGQRQEAKQPPSAQQAEHVLEDGGAEQTQQGEALPAAQQARHVTDAGMEPKESGTMEDSLEAVQFEEGTAHPQDFDGHTFFDAQEGETRSSTLAAHTALEAVDVLLGRQKQCLEAATASTSPGVPHRVGCFLMQL